MVTQLGRGQDRSFVRRQLMMLNPSGEHSCPSSLRPYIHCITSKLCQIYPARTIANTRFPRCQRCTFTKNKPDALSAPSHIYTRCCCPSSAALRIITYHLRKFTGFFRSVAMICVGLHVHPQHNNRVDSRNSMFCTSSQETQEANGSQRAPKFMECVQGGT